MYSAQGIFRYHFQCKKVRTILDKIWYHYFCKVKKTEINGFKTPKKFFKFHPRSFSPVKPFFMVMVGAEKEGENCFSHPFPRPEQQSLVDTRVKNLARLADF